MGAKRTAKAQGPLFNDAVTLLDSLGVAGAGDDPFLPYLINSVTERVKNETNQQEIPEGLHWVSVELVVGEYLTFKKNAGQLDMNGLDFEAAVKQIQEGDTNTVFAVGDGSTTPEQRLDALINYLVNGRTHEFIRYRRIVW